MGDVFDALNRAGRDRDDAKQRENQTQASPPPAEQDAAAPASDDSARDDQSGALPLSEMGAAAGAAKETGTALTGNAPAQTADDEASPDTPADREDFKATVAEAQSRSDAEAGDDTTNPMLIRVPGANVDPSSNGYARDVVVHHDRGSLITEQYRQIRTQILARGRNRKLHTHVITSSAPGEGKSVTCVNLGIAFAELRNQKTLLIEGDLRRPSFGRLLNRRATPGLIQMLRGETENIEDCLHETVYDNLQILPAGDHEHEASTQLLSSPRMMKVIEQAKDRYDHIFIDTPPVITVTDACILGAAADEVLMVVRLHKTQTNVVERSKRLLRASNCELAGVILTHMVNESLPKYLYRYQYK